MPAPTFVAEYETSDWDTNPSSKTVSVTASAGDRLVVLHGASNGGGTYSISGGGLTWTLRQGIHISTSWCDANVWTADVGADTTFDLTITKSGGSPVYGFVVLRVSGSAGIGASSKANVSASGSTGVSLGITTTQADSMVAWLCADWDALSGASRAYLTSGVGTFTEQVYANSSFVTAYAGYHANVGAAGAKTVGMSAPLGQKYSIVAVEVLGAAGMEEASGGSATVVEVIATGGGRKLARGGSDAAATAVASGGGTKASSGGAAAAVGIAAAGGGFKRAYGGSTALVSVGASGEGSKHANGGASATVTVAATGGGTVSGETMADRDITILSWTVPTTGWEANGPTTGWSATKPTAAEISGTAPTTGWSATPPKVNDMPFANGSSIRADSTERWKATITADHDITGKVIEIAVPPTTTAVTTWHPVTVDSVVETAPGSGMWTASFHILVGPNGGTFTLAGASAKFDVTYRVTEGPPPAEQPTFKVVTVTSTDV